MKGYVAIPIRLPTGELTGYPDVMDLIELRTIMFPMKQQLNQMTSNFVTQNVCIRLHRPEPDYNTSKAEG